MKAVMFAAIATLVLTLSASAQNVPKVPSLCKPCIFYGGDFGVNDGKAEAFADGNTLSVPDTAIYAAVDIPKNVNGVITGILSMQLATSNPGVFDPNTTPYDIRIGVSEGNGGTSVASGASALADEPYIPVGSYEIYQTAVNVSPPFKVTPGTRYWFSVVPQCSDTGNSQCNSEYFYLPNTTEETNGLNAGAQPPYQMFWNSTAFEFDWLNLCDGNDSPACARASFGLMGHR